MNHAVITSALNAQRRLYRQDTAYDGFINFITKFAGRNRAERRRKEQPQVEVLVGGSLLFQALLGGVDMTALTNRLQAEADAKVRKKAGAK